MVVKRDGFLHGRNERVHIAETANPFLGHHENNAKVIGRPPVQELKPIKETRQPLPATDIAHVSRPTARVEHESQTLKQRPVVKAKDASVFVPQKKVAPLKNVVKEKGVDQAPPPVRHPGMPPAVAPATQPPRALPAEPPKKQPPDKLPPVTVQPAQPGRPATPGQVKSGNEAPLKQAPPPAQAPQNQPPVSKRQFKRVPEPQGGGAPPAQQQRPQQQPRQQRPPQQPQQQPQRRPPQQQPQRPQPQEQQQKEQR
jgi:hypothetical protein